MLYLYMRKYNNCCFFFFPKIIEDMSKDIGIGGVRILIVKVRLGRFGFFKYIVDKNIYYFRSILQYIDRKVLISV